MGRRRGRNEVAGAAARRAKMIGAKLGKELIAVVKSGSCAAELESLLARGADVNAKDEDECTALYWAIRLDDCIDMVQLLIDHGADVSWKDAYECTPLHSASFKGNVKVVEMLLTHGCDVNAQETDCGWTPMHFASYKGREEVVNILLAHGADNKIKSNDGLTPLHVADEGGHNDVAKALLMHCSKAKSSDVKASSHQCAEPNQFSCGHIGNANNEKGNSGTDKYKCNNCGATDLNKEQYCKCTGCNKVC